ncbi:hypothetical protein DFH09DRAFT_1376779 [Mycena vulgaris]|nr:hypothetical protein DFH09DRAFT_1376779 [Mycena vulgaris]
MRRGTHMGVNQRAPQLPPRSQRADTGSLTNAMGTGWRTLEAGCVSGSTLRRRCKSIDHGGVVLRLRTKWRWARIATRGRRTHGRRGDKAGGVLVGNASTRLSLRPVPITLPPSNPSWRFAPSPAFLAAALAPLSVTLARHAFATYDLFTISLFKTPSSRLFPQFCLRLLVPPPPPPRICVSSCWVEPTPRELTSCAKRTVRASRTPYLRGNHHPQPGTQPSPSCALRVLRSASSAPSGARICRRTYTICPRIRRLLGGRVRFSRCRFSALSGFPASARTGAFVVEPLRVQHGAESARPLLCGISFPGPREREVGGGQHVWPDPLRSIWGLGAEVACLPVSGRDA